MPNITGRLRHKSMEWKLYTLGLISTKENVICMCIVSILSCCDMKPFVVQRFLLLSLLWFSRSCRRLYIAHKITHYLPVHLNGQGVLFAECRGSALSSCLKVSVCAKNWLLVALFVCLCVLVFQSLSAAVCAVSHVQWGIHSTCLGSLAYWDHQGRYLTSGCGEHIKHD